MLRHKDIYRATKLHVKIGVIPDKYLGFLVFQVKIKIIFLYFKCILHVNGGIRPYICVSY